LYRAVYKVCALWAAGVEETLRADKLAEVDRDTRA